MNLTESLRAARSAVAGVLVAAFVAGCASMGNLGRPAEEIVLERAQARWNALVDRDYAVAYQFLTPGYRAVVPQRRYAGRLGGLASWESAKATSAKCEERRCVVQVEIEFRLALPGHADRLSSTFLDEIWVLEDGQWFKFEEV